MRTPLTLLLIAGSLSAQKAPEFCAPERLTVQGNKPIATEEPGFAAPAWHDVNGDGRADLVVGQFQDGKMNVYTRNADGAFAAGEWLEAGGEIAKVPGVW